MPDKLLHKLHRWCLGLMRLLAPAWCVRYSKALSLNLLLHPKQLVDFILYRYGVFEPEVLHFIRDYCPKESSFLFVDIGSHLGTFSLYVARHYPKAQVMAFEPQPDLYQQQAINQQLNDVNYALFPYALGNEDKDDVTLFVPDSALKDAYGASNNGLASLVRPDSPAQELIIQQKNTGTFLQEAINLHAVLLFKLDVEGSELAILQSLLPLLATKSICYIIIELLWQQYAEQCTIIDQLLVTHGFRMLGTDRQVNGNYCYGR